MTKNLNHHDWVIQQFEGKYLESTYRDVIIHSSIIEGMLANESDEDNFDSANKLLLCSRQIDSSEFCVFNKVRKTRNKLVHGIFKNGGLPQNDIDELRDDLMKKIHEAYRMSNFLNEKLFKKYKITRAPSITFNPTP